jgi:hypothetical protein
MKNHRLLRTAHAAVCLAGAASALAQFDDEAPYVERNRLSVGARFSFGISARVESKYVPRPIAPVYDDGFVLPDVSGGAGGKTWNWGYLSENQIVGDQLDMHTLTDSPSVGRTGDSGDGLQAGFEIMYGRQLGSFKIGKRTAAWGIEAGFSSLNAQLETDNQYAGMMAVRTASYGLGGIVAPTPPYSGSFDGPGPLIDLQPSSVRETDAYATSRLQSEIDSWMFGLKLGPFLEVPISKRFTGKLGVGVAALAVQSDFAVQQQVRVPGIPDSSLFWESSTSQTDFVIGAYGEATVIYSINEFLSVYAGAQYQFLNDVTVETGGTQATIQFDKSFELVVGLSTSF